MLNIDTLDDLYDLTANTLYTAEVARLPKLTILEEQNLVAHAHMGDAEARQQIIVSCLHYALGKARVIYNLRQLTHDDLLDLAQVGNLAMLEDFERALQRNNPLSYLRGIARRAITLYCAYRSSLISKPASLTQEQREKRGLVTVESLDTPLSIDGTLIRLDFVEAPVSDPATLLEQEEHPEERRERNMVLYQALEMLSPRERQVLTLRFGLDGQPGMRRDLIGELIGGTYSGIKSTESKALERLRSALGAREASLACFDADEI